MRIAVFGAAGRTGRDVVRLGVNRGHDVTAFVRSVPEGGLDATSRVETGDARDPDAVAAALEGADAVVSAMGPRGPGSGTVYSDAIATLAAAMAGSDVRRLVIAANSRVLDDRPLSGPYAEVSEEHRRALNTLRASDLEWTVVATPMLDDDPADGGYDRAVDHRSGGDGIDRADFAAALLDALDHDEWIGHVVDVSHAG
jgi:putative NADH-flavin reductase